jgi:hypothetical protein
MAQQTIRLPAQIDLRLTPQVWTAGIAEYVGWVDQRYSGVSPVVRVVEPAHYAKLVQRVNRYLPENIRTQVPLDGAKRFSDKLRRAKQQRAQFEVLISDVPPGNVPPGTKPFDSQNPQKKVDGWQMRKDFLQLEHSSPALVQFLNRYGAWDKDKGPWVVSSRNLFDFEMAWRPPLLDEYWWQPRILVSDEIWYIDHVSSRSEISGNSVSLPKRTLVAAQSLFRDALTWTPEKWFDLDLSRIEDQEAPRPTFPHFVIEADTCFDVIRTSITIDHLRGTKFRMCARPDCGMPFAIESRHKRAYCCQYCAHLESVRRNRQPKQRKGDKQ